MSCGQENWIFGQRKRLISLCKFIVKFFFFFQLTGLPTTSGGVGTKEAPKQAVAADADADLQARLIYLTNLCINFTKSSIKILCKEMRIKLHMKETVARNFLSQQAANERNQGLQTMQICDQPITVQDKRM